MTNIPPQILDFLKLKLEFSYILPLPHFYPTSPMRSDFLKFQEGYRYDANTKESLISEEMGTWQADWYVIASNYFRDPLMIKLTEEHQNFPVYFAGVGAGTWDFIEICPSLEEFTTVLQHLYSKEQGMEKAENYPPKAIETALNYLQSNLDIQNRYWKEVMDTLEELRNEEA